MKKQSEITALADSENVSDDIDYLEAARATNDVFRKLRERNSPYKTPEAKAFYKRFAERLPQKYIDKAIIELAGRADGHNVATLAAAHAYADAGLHVIDSHGLKHNGKGTGPVGQVKIPRGTGWQNRATRDHDEISQAWRGEGEYPADSKGNVYPFAPINAPRNLSVVFPDGCGLMVIDLDGPEGLQAWADLEAEHGPAPKTWESVTGSGGRHLIFRAPGVDIRNTASAIAPGVDVRGANGQIVVSPSLHPNGTAYDWLEGCMPGECEVADAPEWLVQRAYEATKHRADADAKIEKEARAKRSAKGSKDRVSGGFDAYIGLMGHGEGLHGFDKTIYQAALSYYATGGDDNDALIETLRDAIFAAPCKDDRNVKRYATDDYLPNRVAQARTFIAEQTEAEDDTPFDITASLGDTMGAALASLERGFRYVNIGGEGRFIRHLMPGEPPKLEVWSTTALTNWYADRKITTTLRNEEGEVIGRENINPVPVFFTQTKRWDGTAFAPYPAEIGLATYNLFRGFTVEPEPGDCDALKAFIRDVICAGDTEDFKWLWHWMAHLVQRPGEKPKTALVIWGEGGIGKGTFGHLLRSLVHPYGTTFGDADAVVGRWSGQRHAMNLVCVSEEAVFSGDRRVANALKHKVDHEECDVEVKNIQPITMPSFTRYVFDSNHPDAINIEGNGSERRYFVRRVSNRQKGNISYFKMLRKEIEGASLRALFHELASYNPADAGMEWSDVLMAPETHDRKLMERETMRPVYRAFAQMMEDGEFLHQDGLEKYRFDLSAGQTLIPKRMLHEFVTRHGDSRQAAETDPARVFERLYGQPLTARRARSKCYYRRANEDDADTWTVLEQNVQCYDLRIEPLMLPAPET